MAKYDPGKHCGARKSNGDEGDLCTRPKGWGTEHRGVGCCKWHAGATPSHNEAARRELLVRDCDRLGLPRDIPPETALIEAVKEAAGNVEFYRAMVQELPQHPAPDLYVVDEDGAGHWERGEPGIYARTYHVSGLPTGEAKAHILVQLYNDERKRLAEFASIALQRGVEDRMVRLAERDGAAVAQMTADALITMGLGDRLEEFRGIFYERLRSHVPEPISLGT